MVVDMDLPIQFTLDDVDLLARVLYSECRGEPILGQYAVAQCVLDRTLEGGWFGKSLEGVLKKENQFAAPGKLLDNLKLVAHDVLLAGSIELVELVENPEIDISKYQILYFRRTKNPQNNSDWYAPYLFRIGNHAFYGYEKLDVTEEG